MEILLTSCLGIGLSAACGFRVFVPLLAMGVASRAGHLQLTGGWEWIASDAALVALGLATVCEVTAYYVPWLDNALDIAGAPVAVTAGIVATAASVETASPLLTWGLAVIGGGGVAGAVHLGTTMVRGASSLMTAGVGNPLVSTAESGGAIGLAALAIAIPVVAFLVVISVLMTISVRAIGKRSASSSA